MWYIFKIMGLRDYLQNILKEEVFGGVSAQVEQERSPDYVAQPEGHESLFSLGNLVIGTVMAQADIDPSNGQQFLDFGLKVSL